MTGAARRLLACVALVVTALFAPSAALAKFTPPPIDVHLADTSGRLSQDDRDRINAQLEQLRQRTGYDIGVLVLGSLDDETIEDIAYETFNAWKLGQAKKDNGVLLAMAPYLPPGQRKVRIETGKGVEGALTDLETQDILRKVVEPRIVAGDVTGAILQGTRAIGDALVRDDPGTPQSGGQPEGSLGGKTIFFIVLLVVVILLFSRGGGFWWMGPWGGGGGGFGGGGGGFGGGGIGRGGSSGGGGSSDTF